MLSRPNNRQVRKFRSAITVCNSGGRGLNLVSGDLLPFVEKLIEASKRQSTRIEPWMRKKWLTRSSCASNRQVRAHFHRHIRIDVDIPARCLKDSCAIRVRQPVAAGCFNQGFDRYSRNTLECCDPQD